MLIKFGHKNTTTTGELNKIGKELFGSKFLGVFAADRLPNEIYDFNKSKYVIINVDTTGMSGSHWVAIIGIPSSNKILVFDSFGRASKTLLPLLRQENVIDTDPDAEQKKIQESCGQFSLSWLVFVDRYGFANAKLI